jgi:hypothetical protein
MHSRIKRLASLVLIGLVLSGSVAACDSPSPKPPSAQDAAKDAVASRKNYIPKNDVEGHNYNARQELADQPSSLIWCTVYPTNPNAKAFTVPIVGKLTSGNKRPYPTEVSVIDTDTPHQEFNPELPGNDGFYGTSGEYRYGFDPAGNYHDFYNVETYCTSVPSIIQKQTTQIAITAEGDLTLLDAKAQEALKACRAKDPDPSKPCPEAARLLGV